jgi:hypothetical protein
MHIIFQYFNFKWTLYIYWFTLTFNIYLNKTYFSYQYQLLFTCCYNLSCSSHNLASIW